MKVWLMLAVMAGFLQAAQTELEMARDREDRASLEQIADQAGAAAQRTETAADGQYRAAVAYSYLAEVAQELHDKGGVKRAAEAGIRAAERAVALKPDVAGYRRILGTLYGQIVPVNLLLGLIYGKKSQNAMSTPIHLRPKPTPAYP